jgi:hypothetical protein
MKEAKGMTIESYGGNWAKDEGSPGVQVTTSTTTECYQQHQHQHGGNYTTS